MVHNIHFNIYDMSTFQLFPCNFIIFSSSTIIFSVSVFLHDDKLYLNLSKLFQNCGERLATSFCLKDTDRVIVVVR